LTQERIAENQSTFRELNERIEAAAEKMDLRGLVPFICECPDRTCTEIVQLSLFDYEALREHPRRFFSAPGHEAPSIESGAAVAVGRGKGFVVVDKIDVAGAVAQDRYEKPLDRTPDG
jgi:hypothetical protein